MYRIKHIQDKLLPLVGWRQDYDPAHHIDDALTYSESGLYFQGAHPLVTLDNIRAVMPEQFVMQYPDWNADTDYALGAKVKTGNGALRKVWRNKVAGNSGHIPEEGAYWEEYSLVSDYLTDITKDAIATTIQKFANDKLIKGEGKNILDCRAFYDGAGRMKDTISNNDRIVGYELVPARYMGITTKIERISLQMQGASGNVKLYLFHSSKTQPIWSQEFTVAGDGSVQWFKVKDLYLPYLGDETGAGGSWYLCYNQAELPVGMEAINISRDWSNEPCGSCNKGDLQYWRSLTKYLQILPFRVRPDETFTDSPELWDVSLISSSCTECFGINVETTIACDLTSFIVTQRQAFQTVIQKQVAVSAMRLMAMNPHVIVHRNNKNVTRNDILYELDGNPSQGLYGIGAELRDAYKALSVDTSGIDRVCLPCNNRGVSIKCV